MPVPASGPRDARFAVVGMAPAREEVRIGRPLVGPSGSIFNDSIFSAGLSRENVFATNVLDEPTPFSTIFQEPRAKLEAGIARLTRELEQVRPNVILVLGNDPLQVLCGMRGIQKWRGSIIPSTRIVPGTKVVPAIHPASFIRGQWKWLPVFKHIDVPRAVAEMKSPEFNLPKRDSIVGPSFRVAMEYLRWLMTQDPVSLDYEMTSDYSEISCVGLGARSDEAICLPMTRSGHSSYWTLEEECTLWQSIAQVLQSRSVIAQNAGFEWLHSWRYGIFPKRLYLDTMTAHHCLYPDFTASETIFGKKRDPDTPGHGLAFINSQYTRTPYYKDDGRKWEPSHGDEAFWRYNCLDVMVTYDCAMQMESELKGKGLWDFYDDYYREPFYIATRMEWDGVRIDAGLKEDAKKEYQLRSAELEMQINETLGRKLNVRSPKQMAQLLYDEKGYAPKYKVNKKTGKKSVTADKDALEFYASKRNDHVLRLIIEKRAIDDLIGDVLEQALDSNNHIHTHYRIGGTNGSRWSSTGSILGSGTNLQNLPRDGIARRLFLP